jgi:hypothetical protein
MPHTLPARRLILAELDAAIGNATERLRWRRLVLRARTVAGWDTIRAKALLRRAEDRLTSLRADRRFLLRSVERSPFAARAGDDK